MKTLNVNHTASFLFTSARLFEVVTLHWRE